ncbi:hypothetical protein PR048_005339 [Dryococelus australis]|uniref:DDE Tnp4 domain-containing protein n=1 Tax=Dryococelus australis TaxID=614101 RepID=A0ABQ9I7Y7_9NEOP|nr:hypothetical protein PR048_005339 [Dryococelus australis]
MILGNIVSSSVDGCHVRLDKPVEDKDAYVNRKHYFSVHLQGTLNEKRTFVEVFIGYPCSVHDAKVFANPPLLDDHPTLCEGDGHVLEDSAYPCLPQLIAPYKDNRYLTRAQRSFNRVHNLCRIIVEHAFGCLKQRFRHRAGDLMPMEEDGNSDETVRERDVRNELCPQLAIRE